MVNNAFKILKAKSEKVERVEEVPLVVECIVKQRQNSATITLPRGWVGKRVRAELIGE